MTLEDDAALSAWEWMEFLDACPELDAPARDPGERVIVVLLADHIHIVERKMWALLVDIPANQ